MHLDLIRDQFTGKSTGGVLYIDGDFFCYTLEDKDRQVETTGEKVYGKTAIPRGVYKVIVNLSPKFQRYYPRLLDVPGYQGVLIHEGNTDADTEGCILVGMSRGKDIIHNSTLALARLMEKLQGRSDITINITAGAQPL